MEYRLSRRTVGQTEWKSTAKGAIGFITDILLTNLESPELAEFEWKVSPEHDEQV